jgi:hypothetical protein
MLIVGYAVVFTAASRKLWWDTRYWTAVGVAAAVSAAAVSPLVAVYAMVRQTTGFARSIDDSGEFSANWRAYLASSAYAHAWMTRMIAGWTDVLFPGFTATVAGIAGLFIGWVKDERTRGLVLLYGSLGALAFWESFGPNAFLYRLTYAAIPGFSFMRAPDRFGVIVVLALAVVAAFATRHLLERVSRPMPVCAILALVAAAELAAPLKFVRAPEPEPAYLHLAALPWGPLIEMPVYSAAFGFARERYMLGSTTHWMPLVDAYSDYIPQDFTESLGVLGAFPTLESLKRLERDRVRYAIFHVDRYRADLRAPLDSRLLECSPYLRRLYADRNTWLYEIVAFPP